MYKWLFISLASRASFSLASRNSLEHLSLSVSRLLILILLFSPLFISGVIKRQKNASSFQWNIAHCMLITSRVCKWEMCLRVKYMHERKREKTLTVWVTSRGEGWVRHAYSMFTQEWLELLSLSLSLCYCWNCAPASCPQFTPISHCLHTHTEREREPHLEIERTSFLSTGAFSCSTSPRGSHCHRFSLSPLPLS